MIRTPWIPLVGALLAIALLLAWADSTIFQPLFPEPFPVRRSEFRPAPLPLPAVGRREVRFTGFGPVGGLYSFWWFFSTAVGAMLVTLAAMVILPGRVRRAAERVGPVELPVMFVAGVAAGLLGVATTVLLRISLFLLSMVPVVWALAAIGVVFGVATLALATGRWLQARLGPAPPLLAAATGLLALLDVALVPVAGWLLFAVVSIIALGLAVLTRFGSPTGWSLEELKW